MLFFPKNPTLLAGIILHLCSPQDNALLVPFNKWISAAATKLRQGAGVATAVICVCGLPLYSIAEEPPSLQSQLKLLQNEKVASQKSAIELAEQDLQTKELLYPEGRLIGRGIINRFAYFPHIFVNSIGEISRVLRTG